MSHHVEDVRVEILRMRGREAEPFEPRQSRRVGEQRGEAVAVLQILAVGVDVLSEQRNFARAALDERLHLVQNVLVRAGLEPAAHVRDYAV